MKTNCSALILCGGQSSRMGTDKTKLPLGGQTLVERAVSFWQPLCAEVLLAVGYPGHFATIPPGSTQVYDAQPGCGPMGGLLAGLLAAQRPYLMVSAVDMPFLEAEAAGRLWAGVQGHEACVFTLDGRPEPLFGLYACSCLPKVNALLEAKTWKLRALLQQLDTVYLPAAGEALFFNVNTPEAFALAQRQTAESTESEESPCRLPSP